MLTSSPCWPTGAGESGKSTILKQMKLIYSQGFSKSERSNIDKDELRVLQEVAKELLGFNDRQLAIALAAGEILEICDGDDKT